MVQYLIAGAFVHRYMFYISTTDNHKSLQIISLPDNRISHEAKFCENDLVSSLAICTEASVIMVFSVIDVSAA